MDANWLMVTLAEVMEKRSEILTIEGFGLEASPAKIEAKQLKLLFHSSQ